MRIALGCDHRGLKLKRAITGLLDELGYGHEDFGCYDENPVDYPDIAKVVAEAVSAGKFDRGILVCASGIGMSIAANKVQGIRAALCCDVASAVRARLHNDANILCLGEERNDIVQSLGIVRTFLSTTFEGGRHLRRLEKIRSMETGLA